MKAIQLPQPGQVTMLELPQPVPAQGQALIHVKAAGICGSDIGALRGVNPLVSYPRVIGHEIAGEVISIPENKQGIQPGDRVIVDPYLYCGHCYPCSIGRTNCCTGLQVLGVHVDGGMAEYFTHPAHMLVKAPAGMPWDLIPLAEPLTIALHGLHRAGLAAGEAIVILGAGAIGLLAGMAALHYGAVPVLVDPVAARLELARTLGITRTVCAAGPDVLRTVSNLLDGQPPQVVMECSGANSAIRQSLDLVSHAGRVILTGWPKEPTPIPTDMITRKEIDVRGARTSAGEFEEALALIDTGKVNARAILTQTASIDEAVHIMQSIERNPQQYLKVNILMD